MLHQNCPSGQGRAGTEVGGIRPPFIADGTQGRALVGHAGLEGQFLQLETGVPRSTVRGQKSGEVVADVCLPLSAPGRRLSSSWCGMEREVRFLRGLALPTLLTAVQSFPQLEASWGAFP